MSVSVQGLCLDLFHTLVDVRCAPDLPGRHTADILGVSRSAWKQICFSARHEIRRQTEHREVVRALAHSIDPAISDAAIEQAAEERIHRFRHALMHVPPETLGALSALRELGLRLALVSNASTGEVRAWGESPLARLFDLAVFSCDCGYAKPEPQIYQRATAGLGLAPRACLFVGDGGSEELEGARAVGMRTVWITRHLEGVCGARRELRRRAAHWEIAHLDELPPLVSELNASCPHTPS